MATDEAATAATAAVTAVRSAYAAFAAGDVPVVLGMLDPDVEWIEAARRASCTSGTSAAGGPAASNRWPTRRC